MSPQTLHAFFHRPANSYKYNFGHVLVLGGGPHTIGAPFLAARAALRIGTGLVSVASHEDIAEATFSELMFLKLPANQAAALNDLVSYITDRKVSTLVIGPGLDPGLARLIPALLVQAPLPSVLDGGAFSAFKGNLSTLTDLAAINPNIVLTPHAGEFANLTGLVKADTLATKKKQALQFAYAHQVSLVYKDHHTIVAHADGSCYKNTTGNPGMATAGSGDVLSGIIGGLLAQKLSINDASELGVYIHGLAGDIASQVTTEPGLIASDLITYLPYALAKLSQAHLS